MEALDYNNLTKDALYKILLHANEFFNDPTKLSDDELSSKIKCFNEEFYKREEAKRLKNTKEILMKYYRVEKPQNIPFEVYKKIVDGISEAGKLTIKFAETDYLFLNLPGPENGFTWKLSDIKTDVEDSFREFYNYINRERIIVDIYMIIMKSNRMKI